MGGDGARVRGGVAMGRIDLVVRGAMYGSDELPVGGLCSGVAGAGIDDLGGGVVPGGEVELDDESELAGLGPVVADAETELVISEADGTPMCLGAARFKPGAAGRGSAGLGT